MNTEINCPILSNEKFSKEILLDVVTSLEQLESIKATIFNRLNSGFQERVSRLCNIKARINRANQIISSFASVTDAITLKSKYHYPYQKHNYYIPTVVDKNATKIAQDPIPKLNKNVLNDKNNLGTKSSATKEKLALYDNYLSFATQFKDVVNDLDQIYKQEVNTIQSLDELEPILNNVTSNFAFGTKMKIEYAKKNQFNVQDLGRNTEILKEIQEEKKEEEEKRKKQIQQAPKSIIKKVKMRKVKHKKKLISQNNASVIEFNFPTNVGLGGVSNLNIGNDEDEIKEEKNDDEEYEEEEDEFNDDNQNEIQMEDDSDMPIDYISYNKQKSGNTNKVAQSTINTIPDSSSNSNPQVVSNSVNPSSSVPSPPSTVPPPPSTVPPPPSTVPPPPSSVPTPPPKVPSPPPPVPSSGPSKVVVGSSGAIPPPPPPPPPPPVVPTIVAPKGEEKNGAKEEEGPPISMEEELAKAMSGLKKKKAVPVPQKPKELSMAEQIALQRNRLKKTVVDLKPKPEPEKKITAKDLLRQQIQLRYNNINMHKEDDKDDEGSDEDSF